MGGTALFFLHVCIAPGRRHDFFVANRADPELVFGEDGGVQRNLAPISEGVAAFYADGLHSATTVKAFELSFGGDTKAVGQAHFNLLAEEMIRKAVPSNVALIDFAKVKMPRRQDVGGRGRRKAAARKSPGRAVSAVHVVHVVAGDDDGLFRRLAADRSGRGGTG